MTFPLMEDMGDIIWEKSILFYWYKKFFVHSESIDMPVFFSEY